MLLKRSYLTPNAFVILSDPTTVGVPGLPDPVSISEDCIVVGTQVPIDGPTDICLTDEPTRVPAGLTKVYEGPLRLPTQTLEICTSEQDTLLRCVHTNNIANLKIWVNTPGIATLVCFQICEEISNKD